MIFQKDAGFVINPATSGQSYQHMLLGEKYGVLKGTK
jgi:hypothetical protein